MATPFDKFISILSELFMLNQADLDFGIYRIINQKRNEIEHYLTNDLKLQVRELLKINSSSDNAIIQKELDQLIATLQNAGINPDDSPKVQELKNKLSTSVDLSSLEAEVYSHLATFFRRYYDSGDFMSNRRYKKDVYAIPYEGEEVKLHWANADQYYIKTTENFQNYTFKTLDGKTVHFRLRDASTELNNNKIQSGQERLFAIVEENVFEISGDELSLFFTYEPRSIKQKDLFEQAISVIKDKLLSESELQSFNSGLLSLAPTENNKSRTLLEKHLTDYISKNSFDYFIHKDLGGFLRRELDFYIKNEVLFIDDINTHKPEEFLAYLTQVKTIKAICDKIITFLAQLEDFQKKLWLKKKFIVETNYCITLDRVPENLYSAIIENDDQRKEWVRLFAIDEIKRTDSKDIFNNEVVGYSEPLTMEFLKQNPFLVLDTAFFDDRFKQLLISSIDNFEDQLDGTLINSENFQALNLLQEKYNEKINGIYIDPPYNTAASEIAYKNNYKSSSWISFLCDRLKLGKMLLSKDGLQCVTIDDFQLHELYFLLNDVFGKENFFGTVCIKSNPQGRSTVTGFQLSHEYGLFYGKESAKLGRLERTEEQIARYNEMDDFGAFEWRNFRAQYSQESASMVYPIFIKKDCSDFRIPELEWNEAKKEYDLLEDINEDEIISWPIDETGRMRTWKWGFLTAQKDKESQMGVRKDRLGNPAVYYKGRMKDEGKLPYTIWDKPEYSASTHGANLIADIIGKKKFSYPKSIYAVQDSLKIQSESNNSIFLDFFGGSGTTGHAVINLNRDDEGKRKYIIVEMGIYFDTVTKPRIQKVIYSKDWKNGKPISREGSSHCFKYIRLEQYEDTLNNLIIQKPATINFEEPNTFTEGYLLGYMMDIETRGSLFNFKWFANPFDVIIKATRQNELKETKVDLVETFNYLIGLNVYNTSYPKEGLCVVEGITRIGEKSLIIWRDCSKISNEALNEFFTRSAYSTLDHEYDRIYVNGDNLLQNIRKDEEHWKVVLIEEEFAKRMFEV